MTYNIAIDGPASAGKSTLAKIVAKEKNFIYVDTGSMYRAITVYMIENNIDYNDVTAVESELENINIELKHIDGDQAVILNEENVTGRLRTENIGTVASIVAAYPNVRKKLVELQQKIAKEENVVMDGRDIGTVVLPNANLKIYLDASADERAKRRYIELLEKGEEKNIDDIKKDIILRDKRDMEREISPLKKADDAVYLDVSNMTIEEVVIYIMNLIK